jgi:hypothetical protein
MFHICGMGPHPRQRVWHTFGVGLGWVGVAGFGGLQVPKLLGVTVIEVSNVDSHCVLWFCFGWYMALHLALILTGYQTCWAISIQARQHRVQYHLHAETQQPLRRSKYATPPNSRQPA